MYNSGFQFKQFYVRHDRCAMKVGTDGVLLGAWAGKQDRVYLVDFGRDRSLNNPGELIGVGGESEYRILDVGTGSGLIAMMLAQRYENAVIEAIDINSSAVEQANENFQQSSFSKRLSAFQSSLQAWLGGPYDLIVSNPPYFQNSLKSPDECRRNARHTDMLSYIELIVHSKRLLASGGEIAVILPSEAEGEVCGIAEREGLSLTRRTRVYSKESKPARRVMVCFGSSDCRSHNEDSILVLEDERGGRSLAYRELTKDFYL